MDKILKELNMAFKSIGQKYGFVSAGDVYRQRIAEADRRAEAEHQKAEIAEAIFEKMLDKCIISETLQGEIYSKNTVWKIEREEKSFSDMGGDKA